MNRPKKNNLEKIPVTNRLQNANRKTVVAIVLVCIMALLWGRVLLKGKGGPAAAAAQESQQIEQPSVQSDQPCDILTVKLDVLKGRHDVLAGDMFSTDRWEDFYLENNKEDNAASVSVPEDTLEIRRQENFKKIAKTLKLEAIIRNADGKPYQVFVDDAILAVGSVLTVKEGPDQYELVLMEISENEAVFTWNKTSITLKMTETVEK